MNKLISLANKFQKTLANSYMYEPEEYEETDQDRDFQYYWDDYIGELDAMTWDELWNERKKLRAEADEFEMDEIELPSMLESKLQEVAKRMGKSERNKDLDKRFSLFDTEPGEASKNSKVPSLLLGK